ncbi:MAG: phosphotransferase [Myxococcales bacterium]|nr:phosphotransferase [Myxococcales bacterium]
MPERHPRPFGPGATGLEADLGKLIEAGLGLTVTRVEPLDSGLGLRRFFRVATEGEPPTLIVRVEAPEDPAGRPPGLAPEPPLEPLRKFLADLGLPVPRRWGGDATSGTDWLEDFGDCHLAAYVTGIEAPEQHRLYREVLGWIPVLQRATESAASLPTYRRRLDRALLAYKGELFSRHSLPLALGRAATGAERQTVADAFMRIADVVEAAPRQLAHRDLQSQNVMVREAAAPGPAAGAPATSPRLGMIDFQGAFLAPPEYDLVALLRDSYVELSDADVTGHLDWITPQLPSAPDRSDVQLRFDLLTVARKGKDHARFVFAGEARNDRRWAEHLPRTTRALRAAAARVAGLDPALGRLADWIDRLPETPCAG